MYIETKLQPSIDNSWLGCELWYKYLFVEILSAPTKYLNIHIPQSGVY